MSGEFRFIRSLKHAIWIESSILYSVYFLKSKELNKRFMLSKKVAKPYQIVWQNELLIYTAITVCLEKKSM